MLTTRIDNNLDFFEEEDSCILTNTNLENMSTVELADVCVDLTVNSSERKKALEYFCKREPNHSLESINKIIGMYVFSRVKSVEDFIYELSVNSGVPLEFKILLANGLCTSGVERGYYAMNVLCKDLENIPTPIKIESIKVLMECKKYQNESLEYFIKIINDQELSCDFRYKTILGLEIKEFENKNFFLKESMMAFFYDSQNLIRYRILSGQYLRQKFDNLSISVIDRIEKSILGFSQDHNLDYNIRADSVDVILRLGLEENKIIARQIIHELGLENNLKRLTIYDNLQNVHIEEIEKSAIDVIEYLINSQPKLVVENTTFEGIKKIIDDYFKTNSYNLDKEAVYIALNRIYLDRVLYSKYNCTLENVFIRIWVYINFSEHKEEMFKRLLEELTEMSGTCSTGYITRIINSITGFNKDFGIRISFEDQFIANFCSRVNSKISNIPKELERDIGYFIISEILRVSTSLNIKNIFKFKLCEIGLYEYIKTRTILADESDDFIRKYIIDTYKLLSCNRDDKLEDIFYTEFIPLQECILEFQAQVLEEISNSNMKTYNRKYFNFFLLKILPELKGELYLEFKQYISSEEFDLYIQRAIMNYD